MIVLKTNDRNSDDVCVVRVDFRAGSAHEPLHLAGISHVLEHLLFKSEKDELQKEIDKFGGMMNASTGNERTSYYITVPARFGVRALELVHEVVFKFKCDKKDLEREKEIVLQEKAYTASLREPLYRMFLDGSPYTKSVIGTRESINAITIDDLRDYHRARYCDGGCLLGVTCPNEFTKDVDKTADSLFGGRRFPPQDAIVDYLANHRDMTCIASSFPSQDEIETNKKKNKQNHDPEDADRSLASCIIMFRGPIDGGFRTLVMQELLSFALFGWGLGSTMTKNLRKRLRLTYGVRGGWCNHSCARLLQIAISSESDIVRVLSEAQSVVTEIIGTETKEKGGGITESAKAFAEMWKAYHNKLIVDRSRNPEAELYDTMDAMFMDLSYDSNFDHSATSANGVRKILEGISREEFEEYAKVVLSGPSLVCLSGNNSTRDVDLFQKDVRELIEKVGKDRNLSVSVDFVEELQYE